MKRKLIVALLAAALCIGAALALPRPSTSQTASAPVAWSRYLSVHKDMVSSQVMNLSASGIAQVDDDTFLLCSYSMISRLQRSAKGWSMTSLKEPSVPQWNPTGIFYDRERRLLYVANYTGKDVVVLEYDPDKVSVAMRKRITHDKMIGPENVSVLAEEIWVTDYDGSAVFKFDHDGKMLVRIDCPQAYGILVTRDFVYATSLVDRAVLKIRHSGEVVARQGKLGVEPGQYAWPVALAETHDGNIAVLDAHVGRLTILSPDLVPLSAMGSNGPGADLFNFPYGITRTRSGYALADTLRSRILLMDKEWNIREQIHEAQHISLTKSVACVGSPKEPYTYPLLPGLDLLDAVGVRPGRRVASGARFVGGYNSIDALGLDGRVCQELEMDNPAALSLVDKSFWYMTWAALRKISSGERLLVIGSPQRPMLMVVDPASGAFLFADGKLDLWPVEGKLVYGDGRELDWEATLAPAKEKFGRLRELLLAGAGRTEAFRQTFFPDQAKESFDARYWEVLLSATPAHRDFWSAFKKGDADAIRRCAVRCYLEADSSRTVYFQSLLAVRYLSSIPLNMVPLPAEAFTLTGTTPFYSGHELATAVDNDDPDHYAAAVEGREGYGFSIALDATRVVAAIVMRWHEEAIPQGLEVKFLGADGEELKSQVFDAQQGAMTCILPESDVKPAKIEVRIKSFKGQQRLLLRQIRLMGHPQSPQTASASAPAAGAARPDPNQGRP